MDQLSGFSDSVQFKLLAKNKKQADSVVISINGHRVFGENSNPHVFAQAGIFKQVGRQNIRIRVYYDDSLTQSLSTRLLVLSDQVPSEISYKVIRKIPHNTKDFTQGLFYHNGLIYEGTGQQRQSRIIKTNPADGSEIQEYKLADEFFGEGITRVGKQLYQLTYKNRVGMVYDLETLTLIREFDLQTTEGWGLSYDGENLIVSDGSSYLYFYDPEYFTQTKQLDVANDRGLVNNLNELEYVNGSIWANLYTTNFIAKIDAQTGKVLGRLNLESLFPKDTPRNYDHVLNGIAYNPEANTYYVTGKYWPVMYEIKIND